MTNFFAYGTLMCEDIMREVSGCQLSCAPGTVKGYCRRSVRKEHYPALAPDEKGRVEGVLYRDVPRSAWRRLDRFEGEMYTRQLVEVWMFHGAPITAEAYIVRPEFLCHLEASEWNFANFLRNGKRPFQRDYSGYRDL
jgi:gamma-glutamylcyclotransferase (GGCT)/AIG2-like uncharacterized protein YtfP